MILVVDNYDSFTYNLVHLLEGAGADVIVVRNDEWSVAEVREASPNGILLSPGPGRPADAGISRDLVTSLAGEVPIFGVCLGHQVIGEVFGARLDRAPEPVHGKVARIRHDDRGVFAGLPQDFEATRYHSLAIDESTLPDALEATAWSADGVLMGLRHRELAIEGVQFHPESILTEHGERMVGNWLRSVQRIPVAA